MLFVAWLPYEEILEIDEVGDDVSPLPTVFASFRDGEPPLSKECEIYFDPTLSYASKIPWHRKHHVRLFPDSCRDLEWERGWSERNNVPLSSKTFTLPQAEEGAAE
jgi:hypothetical protein